MVPEREFMMGCGPCGKKDKDMVLWGCTGSHEAEGRPSVSDLLKVTVTMQQIQDRNVRNPYL